jgi:hypothetical protein
LEQPPSLLLLHCLLVDEQPGVGSKCDEQPGVGSKCDEHKGQAHTEGHLQTMPCCKLSLGMAFRVQYNSLLYLQVALLLQVSRGTCLALFKLSLLVWWWAVFIVRQLCSRNKKMMCCLLCEHDTAVHNFISAHSMKCCECMHTWCWKRD